MKVGTDGVLLGAWADVAGAQKILDIGTGTGLISLMVAQRTEPYTAQQPMEIHAIEIDRASAQQAQQNIANSSWHTRLQAHHCSLQTYVKRCQTAYDLIITNPPFFENAHKAPNAARTIARHTDTLTPADILEAASLLLTTKGRICIIYPVEMAQNFLVQSEVLGLVCRRKLLVKPTEQSPVKRILLDLARRETHSDRNSDENKCSQEETLILEERRHVYTPEFTKLVKDFYLKL